MLVDQHATAEKKFFGSFFQKRLLNKYESGLTTPPAEMLIKLADALATTVDYLLTGNPAEDTKLASTNRLRKNAGWQYLLRNEAMQRALPLDPIKGKPLKSLS